MALAPVSVIVMVGLNVALVVMTVMTTRYYVQVSAIWEFPEIGDPDISVYIYTHTYIYIYI